MRHFPFRRSIIILILMHFVHHMVESYTVNIIELWRLLYAQSSVFKNCFNIFEGTINRYPNVYFPQNSAMNIIITILWALQRLIRNQCGMPTRGSIECRKVSLHCNCIINSFISMKRTQLKIFVKNMKCIIRSYGPFIVHGFTCQPSNGEETLICTPNDRICITAAVAQWIKRDMNEMELLVRFN